MRTVEVGPQLEYETILLIKFRKQEKHDPCTAQSWTFEGISEQMTVVLSSYDTLIQTN